jgi:VWFA-related protein
MARLSGAAILVLFLSFRIVFPLEQSSRQKPSKDGKEQLTYKVPVDVIVVNASVVDKKGNPVTDLTADDFKIFEDGKQQTIQTFSLESYAAVSPSAASITKPAADGKPIPDPHPAEIPGSTQPRFISIVVDDVTSPAEDHYAAMIEAVTKFIQRDMGPDDKVALTAGSGHAQYPFTGDKELLLTQVRSLARVLSVTRPPRSTCPVLTDLQAQRITEHPGDLDPRGDLRLAMEETMDCLSLRYVPQGDRLAVNHSIATARTQWSDTDARMRTLIQTLRQHVRNLRHFEGRKSVVLFSNGFVFQALVYDLQDLVDTALRSGIVVNTVDLRGLYTAAPQATQRETLPPGLVGLRHTLNEEDMASKDGTLNKMARDTGGIYYHNSNDLYEGLAEIAMRQAYHYILTYASPSSKPDGRYHKIKLELSRPGLAVSYRDGYYAPKEELSFERRRKEDIQDALRAPGDVNEIPISFSYNYYQVDDTRYEIALVTQVDARAIHFQEEESRRRNQIVLVVVAYDEADNYVDGLVKTVDFNLSQASYAELLRLGIASKVSFHLASGKYKIKAVVREGLQSRMGSVNRTIAIP